MHLNGGKKFSELQYNIFADGKPTNLKRVTRTDGSPNYVKTVDVIWDVTKPDDPEAAFSVLETKGAGMQAWLESHVLIAAPPAASPAAGSGT
jgi:hypothetical protein